MFQSSSKNVHFVPDVQNSHGKVIYLGIVHTKRLLMNGLLEIQCTSSGFTETNFGRAAGLFFFIFLQYSRKFGPNTMLVFSFGVGHPFWEILVAKVTEKFCIRLYNRSVWMNHYESIVVTSDDHPFGCPIIYTDMNSQCFFVHRHLNNAWHNRAHSLMESPVWR